MKSHTKILILGDAGRGKTTFAQNLSKKTGIPTWSTDDFYWKVKFTEPHIRAESIKAIGEVYAKDSWIVDGTTRHLIQEALEKADIIYRLEFSHIIAQYYALIKRNLKRKNESLKDLYIFLKHITLKKYKKGYRAHMASLEDMIKPYSSKIIHLHTHKEIDAELGKY